MSPTQKNPTTKRIRKVEDTDQIYENFRTKEPNPKEQTLLCIRRFLLQSAWIKYQWISLHELLPSMLSIHMICSYNLALSGIPSYLILVIHWRRYVWQTKNGTVVKDCQNWIFKTPSKSKFLLLRVSTDLY